VNCFLLGIIVIYILFMNNGYISNNIPRTENVENQPNNRDYDLSSRLLAQLLYNNENPRQPRTYVSFPPDHPGHLNLEKQIRFVNIIKSSSLSDQYRYGSALGKMYIKKTYSHPATTPEMIGAVLAVET
jgi:hypothetical protein